MKRRNTFAVIILFVLLTLMLTACGKSEFGMSENTPKQMTITAENSARDALFMVGSLEVSDGEQVVFTSDLKKGTIGITLIRMPEEQSIDELPDYDDAESYQYEFSSTDSASDLIPSGSYLVKAVCLKKASGTVQIAVKPTL